MGAASVFQGGSSAEGASNDAQLDLLYRQIGQLKGRAHEPGAANIPAMPVAGGAPLVSVPQAGGGSEGPFTEDQPEDRKHETHLIGSAFAKGRDLLGGTLLFSGISDED